MKHIRTIVFYAVFKRSKITFLCELKLLALFLSTILLFSTTNVVFSQTTNSTDQCKTVMHEQIVQKKIDGKLRLEKIQVPMKICNDTDGTSKKKPSPSPKPPSTQKKVSDDLMLLINSGKDNVTVSIRGYGQVPDFRPTTQSGEYVDSHEIPKEQWQDILQKRKNFVVEKQKDLVKFIEENGGKITYRGSMDNVLYAEIPSVLVQELEKRPDVLDIDRGDYKYKIELDKKPYKKKKTAEELHLLVKSREKINVSIGTRSQSAAQFIEDNGGTILQQYPKKGILTAIIPSKLVKDLEERKDIAFIIPCSSTCK